MTKLYTMHYALSSLWNREKYIKQQAMKWICYSLVALGKCLSSLQILFRFHIKTSEVGNEKKGFIRIGGSTVLLRTPIWRYSQPKRTISLVRWGFFWGYVKMALSSCQIFMKERATLLRDKNKCCIAITRVSREELKTSLCKNKSPFS